MQPPVILYRNFTLPWTRSEEEKERAKKLFKRVAVPLLVLVLIFSLFPAKDVEIKRQLSTPPDRIAKLIIDKPLPPPPPPPKVEEKKKKKPKPKKPEPKVEKKPEPVKPKPVEKPPEPKPDPQLAARERAKNAGLMAAADDLAALRDLSDPNSLAQPTASTTINTGRESDRSLITSNRAPVASGGINTAALSRETGGGGLASRETTSVASPVSADVAASNNAKGRPAGQDRAGSRSREDIELIFDKNKAAIYAIYNRALRTDPTLEGKLVLQLTIAPSGQVTACKVLSSELSSPELEAKLIRRVKLFNFGAKDVDTVVTTKPIDFFPA